MVKTKNGFEVQVGMILYDVNGVYEVLGVDEKRRCCDVIEVEMDANGEWYRVGESWLKTFNEVSKCDK